ncbi:hypothetical protein DFP72DRAFT_579351 [Ephemerocybe angulata]|uniref:Uncharacterized protein n=1 Tax=Ephemerocybe angulata TaxID=980116 RepID=A0A8H6LZZ4_9AGAR|nr:hypothetical protein DFP72DRAFT_579351 [Tulosesus angulatus]
MALEILLPGVYLAAIAVESLLFGVFVVLSFTSLYLLFAREKLSDRPRNSKIAALTTPLIFANVLISSTVTAHWVMSVVRLFQAFLGQGEGLSAKAYYDDRSRAEFLASLALAIFTLIVGDCVMIYRLRTVFNYNRSTTVFPLCCLFGFIACGIGTVFQFSDLSPGNGTFLASIGTVFTFVTNVFCSSFIAWKIYRVNKAASNYSGQSLASITGIIIESAALYTSWTIMFMAAYLASSNLAFLFIDTLPTITAISFMLINVRIGLGWAQNMARSGEKISTAHSIVTFPFRATQQSGLRSMDDRQQRSATGSYAMHNLTVHVERTVVKDTGSSGDDSVVLEPRLKDVVALSDVGSDLSTKRIYDSEQDRYI